MATLSRDGLAERQEAQRISRNIRSRQVNIRAMRRLLAKPKPETGPWLVNIRKANEKEMLSTSVATHGVMEGGGSYNRHAQVPAGGSLLALPLLEEAARHVIIEDGDQPVVIADYGSSQGKNSLAPMQAAIRTLRARADTQRPILVVHIDQAANDFNTLFDVLRTDPERYSADDPNVFPSAIGRSFYESVFPGEYVHLGWSSYAAVWLSRIPRLIPGHFISIASNGEVREAFAKQAADDWEFFLSLRSAELRQGGRLVVVLPGLNDEGVAGFEPLFNLANQVLAEMVTDRVISAQERERMVIGSHPRTRAQILEPFGSEGQFCGLTVEHCEQFALPDAAWAEFEDNGDKEMLVSRHASFFRSVFVPSLATAIDDPGRRRVFADKLENRLKQRLAERPRPFHSLAQTIVLAKGRGSPLSGLHAGVNVRRS